MILPLRLVNKISCAQFHLISALIVKEEDEAHKKISKHCFARQPKRTSLKQKDAFLTEALLLQLQVNKDTYHFPYYSVLSRVSAP